MVCDAEDLICRGGTPRTPHFSLLLRLRRAFLILRTLAGWKIVHPPRTRLHRVSLPRRSPREVRLQPRLPATPRNAHNT